LVVPGPVALVSGVRFDPVDALSTVEIGWIALDSP
jgi:hypothetical protein